jgi:N6-adenosine-specific RNA methylase IME4
MNKKYQIIYADPPWKYYKITKEHPMKYNYAADKHYPTMEISDICDLPIKELSENNCILFMWATFPNLQEGLDVIKSWGFKYKTLGFCWVKIGKDYLPRRDGMGYYTKSNAEVCMISHIKNYSLKLKKVFIVSETSFFTPCGACIDWLKQFSAEDCEVIIQNKDRKIHTFKLNDLMPHYPKR